MGANKEMCKKSKEGEGSSMKRRYLPLELRIKLYEEVHKLRKEGLSYSKIIKEIYKKHGIKLHIRKIYEWIHKKHHPLTNFNKFNDKPTPELTYIVGAIRGDGFKYHYYNKNYILGLEVKDKEFAETFGKNLAKVLSRKEPYKPFYFSKNKSWIVVGYSELLFNFLNKPWIELKPYIEHCQECTANFLRALFDSEGSIYERVLKLCNTDKKLLDYVSYLLKRYFNIDTSLYLTEKAGKIYRFPNGKIYKATKDEYKLYIRTKSLMNFYKYIGFTIKRKQRNLEKAIENQK